MRSGRSQDGDSACVLRAPGSAHTRFSDLDGDVGNLRSDVREMGERLRNVEIQFAKVDQRLLTLERAIIPAADSDE